MSDNPEIRKILEKAKRKCNETFNSTIIAEQLCEPLFDGILCWPPTPPGTLANQSCSNEYIIFTKNGFATRQCDISGQWAIPEGFTEPWTNYSDCGGLNLNKGVMNVTVMNDTHVYYTKWLPVIKSISQFGYILSAVLLFTALFIFIHIKRLHCARNKLHVHLFISCLMRALMSLIKDALFVKGTALPHDTTYIMGEPFFTKENYSWVCKAIISLRNYFIISNYMFLLMEATYLHNLLFLKLFSENSVTLYYCFGWGIPVLFIIPWITLKCIHEDTYCWTQKSNHHIALLIDLPIALSVIINFVLFVIIMRILFVKLTSMYIQQKKTKYKKLIRATLILVPLFGIPHIISFGVSFYAQSNQTAEIIWLLFDQTFIAFQGLFASFAYCFLNSEVQIEVARIYNSFKERNKGLKRRSRTISHTQQIPLNEEMQEMPQNFGTNDRVILKKTSEYF